MYDWALRRSQKRWRRVIDGVCRTRARTRRDGDQEQEPSKKQDRYQARIKSRTATFSAAILAIGLSRIKSTSPAIQAFKRDLRREYLRPATQASNEGERIGEESQSIAKLRPEQGQELSQVSAVSKDNRPSA